MCLNIPMSGSITTLLHYNSQLHTQHFLVPVTMLEIVQAIRALKETFDKYAEKDGVKGTLSRRELAVFMRTELQIVSRNDVAHLKLRTVNVSSTYFQFLTIYFRLCLFSGTKPQKCGKAFHCIG